MVTDISFSMNTTFYKYQSPRTHALHISSLHHVVCALRIVSTSTQQVTANVLHVLLTFTTTLHALKVT
jgi:hypothetical protein